MANRQVLQNGTVANDGTGDTLRDASNKINANFLSLYQALGDSDSLYDAAKFDSDGNLIFSSGAYSTTLSILPASSTDQTIIFPDASGNVSLRDVAETLENKTLLHPTMDDIHDVNDNVILDFIAHDSATHHLVITNGDSANPVHLTVSPSDSADVDILVGALNNGKVHLAGRVVYDNETLQSDGLSISAQVLTTVLDKSTAGFALTLPDGNSIGDSKKMININSETAVITPTSLTGGTTISIPQDKACELVWSGVTWHLLSGDGITIA